MNQAMKEKLASLAGAGNYLEDKTTLERYASDHSLTRACAPKCVVRLSRPEQIMELLKLANEERLPVVPFSSGTDFLGGAVPSLGGILLDMSGMKQVTELDAKLWTVTVAPGVTFRELNQLLTKDGLRVQIPLLTPPNASVLATYLDREPVPGAGDFIYGNEHINTFRVALANGEPFTIGNPAMPGAPHAGPMGPALNWYRLFMCAQGTMGIVYEMNLKLIPLPKAQKVMFAGFDSLSDALRAVKEIQRQELGYECFVLNQCDMGILALKEDVSLTDKMKKGEYIGRRGTPRWTHDMWHAFESFDPLRPKLPAWTVVISLVGWARQPEAKVAWQEKDLRGLAARLGFEVKATVGGVIGLDRLVADELVNPWRMQKRFGFKGLCHELKFHATATNLPKVEAALNQACARHNYSTAEVGAYIQPVERARSFACCYDFYSFPNREEETARLKALYADASEAMIEAGAFFDRPYGPWAEMMYRRNATYTEYLRKVKAELDPNNILNPGKLCF